MTGDFKTTMRDVLLNIYLNKYFQIVLPLNKIYFEY